MERVARVPPSRHRVGVRVVGRQTRRVSCHRTLRRRAAEREAMSAKLSCLVPYRLSLHLQKLTLDAGKSLVCFLAINRHVKRRRNAPNGTTVPLFWVRPWDNKCGCATDPSAPGRSPHGLVTGSIAPPVRSHTGGAPPGHGAQPPRRREGFSNAHAWKYVAPLEGQGAPTPAPLRAPPP